MNFEEANKLLQRHGNVAMDLEAADVVNVMLQNKDIESYERNYVFDKLSEELANDEALANELAEAVSRALDVIFSEDDEDDEDYED